MESGILGYSSRNPESHQRLKSGIPIPLTKNIESSIRNQEYTVRNPESKTVLDSGVQEMFACGNICLWILESWALECGIQIKESGISLLIGIWNPVPWILDPRGGIQNPRLSWIPFPGGRSSILKLMVQFCDLRLWLGMDTFTVLCWSGWQGWIWIQKLEIVGPTFSSFNDMPAKTITKKLWLVLPDEIRSISSSYLHSNFNFVNGWRH